MGDFVSKFKKYIVFIFIILIVAFLYGCSTITEEIDNDYNDFILEKEGNSYTVVKCVSTKGKVRVPSEYKKLPVLMIENYAFKYCES